MELEDAEANATEDELAAERAASSTTVKTFKRRRPARKPFPEHLPRERMVIAPPLSCACCGSTNRCRKLGEDVTRDAGGDAPAMEGDPDGAGAVLLPGLRGDHPAAGAVPCHRRAALPARACSR